MLDLYSKDNEQGPGLAIIRGYCQLLGIGSEKLDLKVETFLGEVNTIGAWLAFARFVFSLGLRNSNFENNFSLIKSLCAISNDNLDKCREKLIEHDDGSYSIDFRTGVDSERIKIMSVHASKGLEFEHIILAGIHTNGVSRGGEDFFGKMPLSFKWNIKDKFLKSPAFILEELYTKRRDFSESKRLFYVACTRAEKYISWVDISLNGKEKLYSKNSWIHGLRKWEAFSRFDVETKNREVPSFLAIEEKINLFFNKPAFHYCSMGVSANELASKSSLGLLPELSVTRMAELANCPRKFYLSSVLKIEQSDLDYLSPFLDSFVSSDIPPVVDKEVGDSIIKSSASRGTEVHKQIENYIKDNISDNKNTSLSTVFESIDLYEKSHLLISEKQLRFSYFGYTINGTPDLVAIPKSDESNLEIWDFKTGAGEGLEHYWAQLLCYGLYYASLGNQVLSLKLIMIDQNKVLEKRLTSQEIKEQNIELWKKSNHYDQVNRGHCSKCQYQKLCREL